VFVRYFCGIDLPYIEAEGVLLQDPSSWLPGLVEESDEAGIRLLARVGFGAGLPIRKLVEVTVEEPLRVPGRTVVPLRWATGVEHSPLPGMEGDLELSQFGPDACHLAMSGRYTPPYGPVGEALDRALLHRVAEATVRDFVERVADAIRAQAMRNRHPSTTGAGTPPVAR
jgi:hypothetical protein